jgi:hypothetical protein
MSEGIKETTDVLVALNKLSVALIKAGKDGFQFSDAASLMANEELKAALLAAYDEISKVPAELKDLDVSEGIQLAMVQVQMLPGLIEAFKKDVVVA